MSDELGITAQGLDTFDKKSGGNFLGHVAALIDAFGVTEIVVGNPIHMRSGDASESSLKAQKLANDLHARFELPVHLWDERLTSEEAKRVLRGSRAAKGTVDRLAAVLILQGYLDYRSNA